MFYGPKQKIRQHWKPGTRLHYQVDYKVDVNVNLALLPMAKRQKDRSRLKQKQQLHLRAELHVLAQKRLRSSFLFAAQVSDLVLMQGKTEVPTPQGLTSVFRFRTRRSGQMYGFQFSHRVNNLSKRILEELARQLEFRLPSSHKGNQWGLKGKDDAGVFDTEIQWLKRGRNAKGTFDIFMKRKLKYTKLSKKRFVKQVKIHQSMFRVVVNVHNFGLESIKGKESYSYLLRKGASWMSSTYSVSIQRFRSGNPKLALWRLKKSRKVQTRRKNQMFRQRAISEYRTLSEAFRAFQKLHNTSKYRAAKAVANFVKANPGQAQVLADQIKSKHLPANHHGLLIHSLELAGTPEAQKALTSIMNDSQHTDTNRTRAIVAANGLKKPTPHLLSSLWSMHQKGQGSQATTGQKSRASTALLALGAIQKANKKASQLKQQIRSQLQGALARSQTAVQKRTSLIAIQNTSDDYFALIVKPYLADTSPLVREAAAKALAKMTHSSGSTWLAQQLLQERVPLVQSTIVEGLLRKKAYYASVNKWIYTHLSRQSPLTLRTASIHYLGRSMKANPQNKVFLAKFGRQESSPALLRILYSYLLEK